MPDDIAVRVPGRGVRADAWVGEPVQPTHLVTLAVTAAVSWVPRVR